MLPIAKGTTARYNRLAISDPPSHRNGPLDAYDLGMRLEAKNLSPRPRLRLLQIKALNTNSTLAIMLLRCYQINSRGSEIDHPQNKLWLLILRSDLASKLLVVDDVMQLRNSCYECEAVIRDNMSWCRDCQIGLCESCYEDISSDLANALHDAERQFLTLPLTFNVTE